MLAGDQVRVRLQLKAPAETEAIASVWLLSPEGRAGPAVAQSIAPGTKFVETTLPRPRDKKGQIAEGIEWYRVAYLLGAQATPQRHGILAVGALATNLFHLSLARPSGYLAPGKLLVVRAFAGNPVTQRPMHGVQVTADLEMECRARKEAQKLTRSAVADRAGEAFFEFPIPDVAGVSAKLHLKGLLRGVQGAYAESALDSEFEALTQAYISLEKDKPLYQPGQTVHLRALAFDGWSHAAANVPLTLTIMTQTKRRCLPHH